MPKKKVLNKQLKKKIAELVSTGLDIKQALIRLGNPVQPNTVYKEQLEDKDFASTMDTAYSCYVMAKQSELNEIANTSASEAYPDLDFREAEATLKRKVDALKFTLAKVAPHLSKRYDKVSKVEHSGKMDTGITVILSDFSACVDDDVDDRPSIN